MTAKWPLWNREDEIRQAALLRGPEGSVGMAVDAGTPLESRLAVAGVTALIGRSVVIKGELDGSEDLTIEGQVEGKIELREHTVTIGQNGRIKAQIFAKAVVVRGEVVGNINASETVDIREKASVDGDIISPRVAIAEGAHFSGSIDMQRKGTAPARPGGPVTAPAPDPSSSRKVPPSPGS